VIARGTADELKGQVGGERLELTVATVGDLALATQVLGPLAANDDPRADEQTRRLSLPVTGGTQTLAEALRRLDDARVEVLDIGLRRPDLDDVFLALTGHAAEDAAGPGQPADEQVGASSGGTR
jgi:ABC-2 type transport system ATP-binding protein